MARHHVEATHVQDFRRRLEAFSQRQSMEAAVNMNSRKRTSTQAEQASQDRSFHLNNDRPTDESSNALYKKPKPLMAESEIFNPDQVSSLSLSSPTNIDTAQYLNEGRVPRPDYRPTSRRQPPTISFADVEIHDFAHSHERELETPADQLDDFDFLSESTTSDSDRSLSEASTPDGPTFGLQSPDGSLSGFIDLSFLSEHERDVLIAMSDRQKQSAENLPISYDDCTYAARLEVAQPSAEDFEASFIEFMNKT